MGFSLIGINVGIGRSLTDFGGAVMRKMMSLKLGIFTVTIITLIITVMVVWLFLPKRNYVTESLSVNPRLVIISQVNRGVKPSIRSRILNIHQTSKIKRLLYFLNSSYKVFPIDALVTGLIVPPFDYYIALRYQNPSEDQLVIVDLPYHYMENIKTDTIYDIAYSPDYGSYDKFIKFLGSFF